MGCVKRIWCLSPMRVAKVQASLRIRAVSPEPPLLAYRNSESRGTFRQKARSLAPLNGWECAVKICHDGMLVDTNLLDAPHMLLVIYCKTWTTFWENLSYATYEQQRHRSAAHLRSLIRTFVVHCLDSITSIVAIPEISRLKLANDLTPPVNQNIHWPVRYGKNPGQTIARG